MDILTYIHTYIHTHINTYICMYIHMYIYSHTHTHTHIYIYIYIFHGSISVSYRQQDLAQFINTQVYKFRVSNTINILQRLYYKSSLHIKIHLQDKGVCT